jgi:N-acetylmuramic acid 6-phosphate etherase
VTTPDIERADKTPAAAASKLAELITEAAAAGVEDLDRRSTGELVELMNRHEAAVPAVVASAANQITEAIDAVVERLAVGGRLVYAGAGTSGRLAALDAAECRSTFSTPPGQVVALLAGGEGGSPDLQDAAEDDAGAGADEIAALRLDSSDAVIGVSASGRTPFVLGAVRAAAAARAWTGCVVSAPGSELGRLVDCEIAVVVGPEVIPGSTRLKAGTAQKLVLNTLSTVTMIRLGKTYGNLMVDVAGTNEKLRARARRIVLLATGAPEADVDAALEASGGNAKVAIVSLLAGIDAVDAQARLDRARGRIREALRS